MNPTEPTSSAKLVFGPAAAVLELAVSGRWRAPETTAALADHAAAQARAESDLSAALLAEGWLLHGLAVVGRGASAVPRAVVSLEDAAHYGHLAGEARLRVGLASVAMDLGDSGSAWALLAPVVEHDIADPELAADAHMEAVRCGGHGADGVLAAVDLAVGCIRRLRGEQVRLGLATLDAVLANRHRIGGRARAAAARARDGLRRLLGAHGADSELDPISPHIAARLTLELTLALLDDGQLDAARRVAEPALAWAGHPAALVPLTRLRLVLAQRAYLPAGEYDAALRAVGWAAGVVGEQDLPELEADCQSLLAEVHEQRGAFPDALVASRRAHQAFRLHSARVEQALGLLGRCAGAATARTERVPVDQAPGVLGVPQPGPEQVTALPDDSLALEATCGYRVTPDGSTSSGDVDDSSGLGVVGCSDGSELTAGLTAVPWSGSSGSVNGVDGSDGLGASDHERDEHGSVQPTGSLAAAADGREVAERDSGTESDELADVFEPDEARPLGLVAIDVATPTGPLTGAPARPLLARMAEHLRAQLPPNSRLRVLARDVILVVLPPVEPDVVSRWMRSVAGGLSARWSEYAADVPRSAFRVAVGTLATGRPVADSVTDLCARLSGFPLQPTTGSGVPPGSGRHVARGRPTADAGSGRANTEPGGGGRRRRPDNGRDPSANGAPAGADGVSRSAPQPSNGVHVNGVASETVALGAVAPTAVATTAVSTTAVSTTASSVSATENESESQPQAPSVSELSYAELLAGALAAYRDG
ncbi:MAG: hypothetical protein M3Z25_10745 [Actinomycetota bacterium]|nr:hypothetical protein [Actinomycetota bacterium]